MKIKIKVRMQLRAPTIQLHLNRIYLKLCFRPYIRNNFALAMRGDFHYELRELNQPLLDLYGKKKDVLASLE